MADKNKETQEERDDIEPIELTGDDPEIDIMAAEKQCGYMPPERTTGRRLSETLVDFVEKVGEGARKISESVHEDGAALAGYLSGGPKGNAK